MIRTVVVGAGLAGRFFHAPLIVRQSGLRLTGFVARSAETRASALAQWEGTRGYADIDEALADESVDLIVLATPHDTHADLTVRSLAAGKHVVVDKVMALTTAEADAMIEARDASGKMLSVFQNRRWDWDFATVKRVLSEGRFGKPLLIESAVCRHAVPRTWRGQAVSAGTILHDWGAHLVDQALQVGLGPCRRLAAWVTPAPFPGVDTGGHGRLVMEFDGVLFQAETSRICRLDKPRWWVVGERGGFVKYGVDPQEAALREGNLDNATEAASHEGMLRFEKYGAVTEENVPTVRASWDGYYANIAAHLTTGEPLAVTAEQAREVVRVLEAASLSSDHHTTVEGPWG